MPFLFSARFSLRFWKAEFVNRPSALFRQRSELGIRVYNSLVPNPFQEGQVGDAVGVESGGAKLSP
jgi:hypothetical protein